MAGSHKHEKSDDPDEGNAHPYRNEMSEFQYSILFTLAEESLYGLGVKRALQEYYGAEVNHGRLYPNLDKLEEWGFVSRAKSDDRTYEFSLTERGLSVVLDRIQWAIGKVLNDGDAAFAINQDLDRQVFDR